MPAIASSRIAPLLAAGLAMLCACTTTKVQTWNKDGRVAGTITSIETPVGHDYLYRDLSNCLVRVEKRDAIGGFLPGPCIEEIAYDELGRRKEERQLDASGTLCSGAGTSAISRWSYSVDSTGHPVVELSYFDAEGKPAVSPDGYTILRQTFLDGGKISKVEMFDADRKPAPSTWFGVERIVQVQYTYLQGVGEVTCAVFFDTSGQVVARKQLSGQTSRTISSTDY
jgi:hypothetical protein